MHDEELRQWLERYITKHPHHPTAVLSRSQFIGFAKRALDAYLTGTYFLSREEGGEGADPDTSGIEEAIRGFRQQIEGVERHGYLGMFVETAPGNTCGMSATRPSTSRRSSSATAVRAWVRHGACWNTLFRRCPPCPSRCCVRATRRPGLSGACWPKR